MKHESYCETRESLVILSRTLDHFLAELKILKDFENDEFRVRPHVSAGRIARGPITKTPTTRHSQLSLTPGKELAALSTLKSTP